MAILISFIVSGSLAVLIWDSHMTIRRLSEDNPWHQEAALKANPVIPSVQHENKVLS